MVKESKVAKRRLPNNNKKERDFARHVVNMRIMTTTIVLTNNLHNFGKN